MTATLQASSKLKPRQLRFAIALAQGSTQAQAFRIAAGKPVQDSTAKVEGWKWAQRPEIQAKVRELQDAADDLCSLRLAEAKRLLADTARTEPKADPTHTDRISAIKAHADLSGWTKANDGLTINLNAVLGQLGPPIKPQAVDALDVTPTRPSLVSLPQGVGDPNAPAPVVAMDPHTEHESLEAFFTKEAVGVFTNEIGEVEEVEVKALLGYDDSVEGHERRRMERKLP